MIHEAGAARDLNWDRGSFRDRGNRIYDDGLNIYRAVNKEALDNFKQFSQTALFRDLIREGKLIASDVASPSIASQLGGEWAGALTHERIPFISYPYEWPFGFLKDAALLQLELLERSIPCGWTLKDASVYNIQWRGAQPVFIDLPSFEPYREGEPWAGYRQFCMMFLYPLMLRAYKGVDYRPLLRSNLEGVEPEIANRILSGFARFKKGVFGHVFLHAKLQGHYSSKDISEARELTETSGKDVTRRKGPRHSKEMVLGTIQGLSGVVKSLKLAESRTAWGDYDTGHSYARESFETKKAFVARNAARKRRALTWDIGCNTGTFSRLCSEHSDYVVAADGDEIAIERLYQTLKAEKRTDILPLVMNVANISPNQGWRRRERKAFDDREKPDLVLCLALVHHIVISANIPLTEFVGWLRDLNADVIIEYVGLEDDMVKMLLRNRINQYPDLGAENFEAILTEGFRIADTQPLKGGHRKLYFLTPK